MPVRIDIPIRIKVNPGTLTEMEFQGQLWDALVATTERAFANSRDLVLAERGGYVGVTVHAPEFNWSGEGLDEVSDSTRTDIEAYLVNIILSVGREQGVYDLAEYGDVIGLELLPSTIEDIFDIEHLNPLLSSYLIPTYDDDGNLVQLEIVPGGEEEFWHLLRLQVLVATATSDEEREGRERAIELLVELRNLSQAEAMIREGLDSPLERNYIRWELLDNLATTAGSEEDIAWGLILYAVGHINETVAEYKFKSWFEQNEGRNTVSFLQEKLDQGNLSEREKASQVVLFLLELGTSADAVRLAANLQRLQRMALEFGLWTGGELGEASLRQLSNSQINILLDWLPSLERQIQRSPIGDPYEEQDLETLAQFRQELLQTQGTLENTSLESLDQLDQRLAQILEATLVIREQVATLHRTIEQIREFLEDDTVESDEITALFNLRHDYICALGNSLSDENFAQTVQGIYNAEFFSFPNTVAELKWRRVKNLFRLGLEELSRGENIFTRGPTSAVPSSYSFDRMWQELRDRAERLNRDFYGNDGSSTHSISLSSGSILRIPIVPSLNEAINAETDVTLFRIQVAMFLIEAISLRLHNEMETHSIGTSGFREEQGTILRSMRREIESFYNQENYQPFLDNAQGYVDRLQEVGDTIQQQARLDLVIELLITAIAALLTVGVAVAARLALIGRIIRVGQAARSASAIVVLAEAGTFTLVQLTGRRLAFGREVTLGDAASSFIGNVALFGAFRLLGQLTSPLAQSGRASIRILGPHVANFTVFTGISALVTRIQTGRWPQNISQFILHSIASYVIIAAIGHVVQNLSRPLIEARYQQVASELISSARQIDDRFRASVERGTITEIEFNAYRDRSLELVGRGRELIRFLRNEGILSRQEADGILNYIDEFVRFVRDIRFVIPPALTGTTTGSGGSIARALPQPSQTPGLVRIGARGNIYQYQPAQSSGTLSNLLAPYEQSPGYRVQRFAGGIIQVSTHGGEILFILRAGPIVLPLPQPPDLPALPAPSTGTPRPITFLELVIGLRPAAETEQIRTELAQINPRLIDALEGEFPRRIGMTSLSIFVEQRGKLTTRWNIDGIRGVATMLQKGHRRSDVRRLFVAFDSNTLNTLFRTYLNVAEYSGIEHIVGAEIVPSNTRQMVQAYDAVRRARLQLPDSMTRQAVRGLARRYRDATTEAEFTDSLGRIRLRNRLARLEADSPIVDPRAIQDILLRHNQDIRPSINLLQGTANQVVLSIEAFVQPVGGHFFDLTVRSSFERMIERYQNGIASMQQLLWQQPVLSEEAFERQFRSRQRLIEGDREEINSVLLELERGGEVFSAGAGRSISIDPSLFPLSRGYSLINAPSSVDIQLDVGLHTSSGQIRAVEATTGELSLPEAWRGLDPNSGLPPNGTIDWNALNPDNASHRKWHQVIKNRAAALFAQALGGPGATPVELVIRAGMVTEPARRALEALDYRIEIVQ